MAGQLDPLHLHFATREVVYPMRLSHLASASERVIVYTLAAHRQSLVSATPGMEPAWAGRVDPGAHPALRSVTGGGTTFLTKFTGTLVPSTITDDFRFASTGDIPYGAGPTVITEPPVGVPAGALFGGEGTSPAAFAAAGVLLLVGILAGWISGPLSRREARRSRTAR